MIRVHFLQGKSITDNVAKLLSDKTVMLKALMPIIDMLSCAREQKGLII